MNALNFALANDVNYGQHDLHFAAHVADSVPLIQPEQYPDFDCGTFDHLRDVTISGAVFDRLSGSGGYTAPDALLSDREEERLDAIHELRMFVRRVLGPEPRLGLSRVPPPPLPIYLNPAFDDPVCRAAIDAPAHVLEKSSLHEAKESRQCKKRKGDAEVESGVAGDSKRQKRVAGSSMVPLAIVPVNIVETTAPAVSSNASTSISGASVFDPVAVRKTTRVHKESDSVLQAQGKMSIAYIKSIYVQQPKQFFDLVPIV